MKLLLLLLVSLFAQPAARQPSPAAPQGSAPSQPAGAMPDPRVMSGIPRVDAQVPVGKLTVRVVQGELAKMAAAGTPVHLIATKGDGTLTRVTQPVGADGRAHFTDLVTTGAVSYMAFAILGEDRLESKPILPGTQSGIRLMLVGRKLDAGGKPVGDPIDDSTEDPKAAKIPAGEVRIRVEAKSVELVEVGADKAKATAAVVNGAATFTKVAAGPDTIYVARAKIDGKPVQSRPFMLSTVGGIERLIRAPGKLTVRLDVAAEIEGDHLAFQVQITLQNLSGASFDPGMGGLVLPVPAGAIGVEVADPTKVTIDAKRGLVWQSVVPPGDTEILTAFRLPIDGTGAVKLALPTPFEVTGGTMIVEKTGEDAVLAPPAGATVEVKALDEGREFFVAKPLLVAAGGMLVATVTGVQGAPKAGDGHGGEGQPDPREMSGIPREESEVKIAAIRVKVVHGELAKIAPVGTPVHLVGIHASGTIDHVTRPLGEDGRALFTDLLTDGSVSYFVFCLLGDDRLESQMIAPRNMSGVAVMLTGRRLGRDGMPIGKPIDDAVDEQMPVKIPGGEVWVAIDGEAQAGDKVELVQAGAPAGEKPRSAVAEKVPNGPTLVARFHDVPMGNDKVWVPRVTLDGNVFLGKPFMMSSVAGVGRLVRAYTKLLVRMHLAGELVDESMQFQVQYTVGNLTGKPFDTGQTGLVLPLPVGAIQPAVPEELQMLVRIEPGRGLIWRGLLPAGATTITAMFGLAVDGGVLDFEMPVTERIVQGQIVVEKAGDSELSPPEGSKPQVKQLDNGRNFWVMGPLTYEPGVSVRFSMANLPQHPWMHRFSRGAAALLVLGIVGMTLFVAVSRPKVEQTKATPKETLAARRKQLVKRRDALYEELVKVERSRPARDRERAALISKLTFVLREIDELDGGPGASGTQSA